MISSSYKTYTCRAMTFGKKDAGANSAWERSRLVTPELTWTKRSPSSRVMNEVEPVSPSPSTPSSGSPPPEDILNDPPLSPPVVVPNSSQAKRRLPTGTPSGHSRDLKTRKRDDGNSRRTGGGGWTDGREGGKQREELVDIELAERLRRDFGDPFDETLLKSAA